MLAQHPVQALAYILHLIAISYLLPVSPIFIQIYSAPELYSKYMKCLLSEYMLWKAPPFT